MAANRNGGMLRLIASRHDDDDDDAVGRLLSSGSMIFCVALIIVLFVCVLADGHKAVFKTQFLPAGKILEEFNRLCQRHDMKKAAAQ